MNPVKFILISFVVVALKMQYKNFSTLENRNNPADTGRKLNVHKTFRRRPEDAQFYSKEE